MRLLTIITALAVAASAAPSTDPSELGLDKRQVSQAQKATGVY